jgi:hypothetical protein
MSAQATGIVNLTFVLLKPVDIQKAYIYSAELAHKGNFKFGGLTTYSLVNPPRNFEALWFTLPVSAMNEVVAGLAKELGLALAGADYLVSAFEASPAVVRPAPNVMA